MSQTTEFKIWTGLLQRCENPNDAGFHNYGGRGIRVCERWRTSFENFLADMGRRPSKRHSVDRKDVNADYSPSNCRWATSRQQTRNARYNRYVEIDGRKLCVTDWCEVLGVSKHKVYSMANYCGRRTVENALRELYVVSRAISD